MSKIVQHFLALNVERISHTPKMDFILETVCFVCILIPVFSLSCRGLHRDAVWSCSRGRLHNGLQLPHVCPAGICYCSVQFWQQASLWVTISLCQPQAQKDPDCFTIPVTELRAAVNSKQQGPSLKILLWRHECVSSLCLVWMCVSKVAFLLFLKRASELEESTKTSKLKLGRL